MLFWQPGQRERERERERESIAWVVNIVAADGRRGFNAVGKKQNNNVDSNNKTINIR